MRDILYDVYLHFYKDMSNNINIKLNKLYVGRRSSGLWITEKGDDVSKL